MKNVLIAGGVLIIIGVFALVFFDKKEPVIEPVVQTVQTQTQTNSYTFMCPGDFEFSITYHGENNDKATLALPDETFELTVATSGSGSRYITEDESVEYWEHQGQVMIAMDGETVHSDCLNVY